MLLGYRYNTKDSKLIWHYNNLLRNLLLHYLVGFYGKENISKLPDKGFLSLVACDNQILSEIYMRENNSINLLLWFQI